MDSEKDNPEQGANSSGEEADFESADEGEHGDVEIAATSADMRSKHSTSNISVGTEDIIEGEGDDQVETTQQQSSEQSSLVTEGTDSSVDFLATGGNNDSFMDTADDRTAAIINAVHSRENPQEHGEKGESVSAETPDGTKDATRDGNETLSETKELSPSVGSDVDSKRESISNLDETGNNTTDSKGPKIPDKTEIIDEPGKGQDESVVSARSDGKEQAATQGGWGWGGWLSQATASVTSGLTSVIETVESSLGVPDPNEMAKKVKAEEEEQIQKEDHSTKEDVSEDPAQGTAEGAGTFLSSLGMSALTNVVHNRGMELVSGGLDALEFIGKRTMDVLSEGDAGLREKRVQLLSKGPTLSQVLREGKEASETKASYSAGQGCGQTPVVDVFTKFEEHQGMAHLEALEILSHECEAKVESQMIDLAEEDLCVLKPVLRAVEQVFHVEEVDEDDYDIDCEEGDFESKLSESLSALNLTVRTDKLINAQKLGKEWLDTCVKEQDAKSGNRTGQEIYETAVGTMGELTARTVEMFHKVAELIMFQSNEGSGTSSLVQAQLLRKLSDSVSRESSSLATHFAGCLNTAADDSEEPDTISPMITNIYLDSSTCASYLQNSCKLLCPILQFSSINEKRTKEDGFGC